MQPHSMCAVALAHYFWNSPEKVTVDRCRMRVEYRDHNDRTRNLYYLITNVSEDKDGRRFSMNIVRDGGGIDCTITVSRNSTSEGAEVTMTHYPEHHAGLTEIFSLYKKQIRSGRHRNSKKYKNFEGSAPRLDHVKLYCDLLRPNGSTTTSEYTLDVMQMSPEMKHS